MPALPGWYPRIPEILDALRAAPPLLDRPAFESLFQVSRRQAIRLMATSGGYQIGKTFLVERDALVAFLRGIAQTPAARHSHQRKRRILGLLRQQVFIAPPPPALDPLVMPGVSHPHPGIVEIRYDGTAADLLARIAALATAAAEDFPRFRETFE
jgi:hypothetical protein